MLTGQNDMDENCTNGFFGGFASAWCSEPCQRDTDIGLGKFTKVNRHSPGYFCRFGCKSFYQSVGDLQYAFFETGIIADQAAKQY